MNISIEDYPVRHFSLKDADGNHVIKNMYDDNVQAFLSDVFEKQAEIDELVEMLEGATNIITGKEVSPIIYNVAKATALIAKHKGE